jgi:hypothetical protein
METFDATVIDKVQGFQKFLYEMRDKSGGLIISLIIPQSCKELMLNPKLETPDESKDFYLYGWYNQCSFPIYVDKELTNSFYVVCNLWSNKAKVINATTN